MYSRRNVWNVNWMIQPRWNNPRNVEWRRSTLFEGRSFLYYLFLYRFYCGRFNKFLNVAGRVRCWWYSWTMDQVVIESLAMRHGMDYFRVTCCFPASYGLWECASPLPWPVRWNACCRNIWYSMESWRWLVREL